ncbi:8095_t:CDS:1, partial [Paraglomus brasilianum]
QVEINNQTGSGGVGDFNGKEPEYGSISIPNNTTSRKKNAQICPYFHFAEST